MAIITVTGTVRIRQRVEVDPKTECWIWKLGKSASGHGQIYVRYRTLYAHRFAYETFRGPIPPGLDLDHVVCDNPPCCNPWHVEPRTRWQNTQRGNSPIAINARKTHCAHGHEFTEENTYLVNNRRQCRACNRAAVRAYKQRKRVVA